jgi:DNA-binding transcriptional MerR regulator
MSGQLEKIRGQKYIGVVELAHQAARILAEIGTTQDRGTVSEMPDERTLRYYLAEGLLSPAAEKQGTASVFGYLHLLQLLVVKKLQSEHLPIRKIKELVDGRTERELERLLGLDAKAGAKNEAHSYLEKLLIRSTSPAAPSPRSQNLNNPATGITLCPRRRKACGVSRASSSTRSKAIAEAGENREAGFVQLVASHI